MLGLKGENRILQFEEAASRVVFRVSALDGVAGIVFLGGLVRGFADRSSDLDMTVFLDKNDDSLRRQVGKIGLEEQKRTGVDVDLEVHHLEDFEKKRWSEVDRWDFSIAKVALDPNGKVTKMISTKLRVPEGFWIRRVVLCAEYMKWYCCPPSENVGTIVETSVERGDLAAAQYCLNYGLDLLLRALFALNRTFLPPQKWRLIYARNLPWLPRNYDSTLADLLTVKSISKKDVTRRIGSIRGLWSDVSAKMMNDMGLSPDAVSRYYVKKHLHQTSG